MDTLHKNALFFLGSNTLPRMQDKPNCSFHTDLDYTFQLDNLQRLDPMGSIDRQGMAVFPNFPRSRHTQHHMAHKLMNQTLPMCH